MSQAEREILDGVRAQVEIRNLEYAHLYGVLIEMVRRNQGNFLIQNVGMESKAFSMGALIELADGSKQWLEVVVKFDHRQAKDISFKLAPLASSYPRNLPDYQNTFLFVCEFVTEFAPGGLGLGKVTIDGKKMSIDNNFAEASIRADKALELLATAKIRKPMRKDYPDLDSGEWGYYFSGRVRYNKVRNRLAEIFGDLGTILK